MQRIKVELRGRRQPAHALGAHVEIDQVSGEFRRVCKGRKQLLGGQLLIAPLAGVVVEVGGAVHLAWRAVPVQREGQRQPAGLRAQLLLADIVRPAAAALPDAAAEDQHVDHPAVVHVHVVPVVHTGPEDDHRTTVSFVRRVGKFTGDFFYQISGDAGNLFAPGRGVGFYLGVVCRRVTVFQTAIEAVVCEHQIVHANHASLAAVGQRQGFTRYSARQHRLLLHAAEMRILVAPEVREGHVCHAVVGDEQGKRQLGFLSRGQRLQVPFAFFTPAEADGTIRRHQISGHVKGDGFPLRIIGFTQPVGQIRRAQHAARHHATVSLFIQQNQHRHVGVAAAIVEEVIARVIKMELFEDHMPHRHGKGAVGTLFGGQPLVAELCHLREVRRNGDGLGAFVTHFGKEVGVRGTRLRHVRAPGNDIAGVVPVRRFRHVGLFAPGHRRRRRQIAIPVIEAQAGAAEQGEIARTGGIRDHRHGRDGGKTGYPIRAVVFDGPDVGGSNQLVKLFPV